ncbi:MAG: hypothetical protein AAGA25_00120 [Planctomycetota bacterium]
MNPITTEQHETLERLRHMALNGRLAEAELELHDWCRKDAPVEARVFLAALLARRDDFAAARAILGDPQRSQPQTMNAEQAKLAVSVLISCGLQDDARRLAAWLYHLHGDQDEISQWIAVMDVPGLTSLPAVPDATVERLASELTAQPETVPSLVYAMQHAPRTRPISLLRAAVARMTREFEGHKLLPSLTKALAELAFLIGDEEDARRWAHKTLRLDPYNASMALLLGKLPDDEAVGPTAQQTLKRVALKFPGYPDVQAAYQKRIELDRNAGRRVA